MASSLVRSHWYLSVCRKSYKYSKRLSRNDNFSLMDHGRNDGRTHRVIIGHLLFCVFFSVFAGRAIITPTEQTQNSKEAQQRHQLGTVSNELLEGLSALFEISILALSFHCGSNHFCSVRVENKMSNDMH